MKKITSFLVVFIFAFSMRASVQVTERYAQAVQMASELHATQARKGTKIPYLTHLLGVSSLVLEYGGTEEEAIAGLLHDAVEDAGGVPTLEKIEKAFGREVARIVDGTTEHWEGTKPAWKARKDAYISHLQKTDTSVLRVAACDKLHNIRAIYADYLTLGEDLWSRFNAGADQTLWFYTTCAVVFMQSKNEEIQKLGNLILLAVTDITTRRSNLTMQQENPEKLWSDSGSGDEAYEVL